MEILNKQKSTTNNSKKAHVGEAASHLYSEGIKFAHEVYEDGLHRAHDAQKQAVEYSDEALEMVRKNPMTSVLIAAGVGFLLSAILRK